MKLPGLHTFFVVACKSLLCICGFSYSVWYDIVRWLAWVTIVVAQDPLPSVSLLCSFDTRLCAQFGWQKTLIFSNKEPNRVNLVDKIRVLSLIYF